MVKYTYDAWGKVVKVTDGEGITISDTDATHIANINPFRYCGYYYDVETKLYYLQSRYYDPAVRRFISPDNYDLLSNLAQFSELNLYTYCNNNPISYVDPSGNIVLTITAISTAVLMLLGLIGIVAFEPKVHLLENIANLISQGFS